MGRIKIHCIQGFIKVLQVFDFSSTVDSLSRGKSLNLITFDCFSAKNAVGLFFFSNHTIV